MNEPKSDLNIEPAGAVVETPTDEVISIEMCGPFRNQTPLENVAPADLMAIIMFCAQEENDNLQSRQLAAESHQRRFYTEESERWRLRKNAAYEEMKRRIIGFRIDLGGL